MATIILENDDPKPAEPSTPNLSDEQLEQARLLGQATEQLTQLKAEMDEVKFSLESQRLENEILRAQIAEIPRISQLPDDEDEEPEVIIPPIIEEPEIEEPIHPPSTMERIMNWFLS